MTWKSARKEVLLLITNRKSYMSFRLVFKSVILNDLERRNGPYFALYFTEFGKPAFQLIAASSSIELIDQKSAFITQSGDVSVRN